MKTAIIIAAAILFFTACSPTEKAKEPHPLLGEKIPETATTIAETSETTPAATVLSLEEYPSEALAEAEKKYITALEDIVPPYYRRHESPDYRIDARYTELKNLRNNGKHHCTELATEYENKLSSAWQERPEQLPTELVPIWTEERQGCTLRGHSWASGLKVHEMSSDALCTYTKTTMEQLFPRDIIKTESGNDRLGKYPSCKSWIFIPSENPNHSLQTLETKAEAAAQDEWKRRTHRSYH